MKQLCFVTGNVDKAKEAQEILGFPLEIAKVEIDEIQDTDIEKIAFKKAKDAFAVLQKPLIVDDAGLYINAWNGFPGPFVKHLAKAGGNELILRLMQTEANRTVILRAVIGFHDGEKIYTFVGEASGIMTKEERGTDGWGFDPIIIPSGHSRTFAEMGAEEKNNISHRKKALEKFREFLQEKNYNFQ